MKPSNAIPTVVLVTKPENNVFGPRPNKHGYYGQLVARVKLPVMAGLAIVASVWSDTNEGPDGNETSFAASLPKGSRYSADVLYDDSLRGNLIEQAGKAFDDWAQKTGFSFEPSRTGAAPKTAKTTGSQFVYKQPKSNLVNNGTVVASADASKQ